MLGILELVAETDITTIIKNYFPHVYNAHYTYYLTGNVLKITSVFDENVVTYDYESRLFTYHVYGTYSRGHESLQRVLSDLAYEPIREVMSIMRVFDVEDLKVDTWELSFTLNGVKYLVNDGQIVIEKIPLDRISDLTHLTSLFSYWIDR